MIAITIIAAERLKTLIAQEYKDKEIPETVGLRLDLTDKTQAGILRIEMTHRENDFTVKSKKAREIRILIDRDSQKLLEKKYKNRILIYWGSSPTDEGFSIESPDVRSSCISS